MDGGESMELFPQPRALPNDSRESHAPDNSIVFSTYARPLALAFYLSLRIFSFCRHRVLPSINVFPVITALRPISNFGNSQDQELGRQLGYSFTTADLWSSLQPTHFR